jgi:hypothetical protein
MDNKYPHKSTGKAVPKYKIVYDEPQDDYIIQTYINSVLGWSFVTVRKTRKEAEEWILGTIK